MQRASLRLPLAASCVLTLAALAGCPSDDGGDDADGTSSETADDTGTGTETADGTGTDTTGTSDTSTSDTGTSDTGTDTTADTGTDTTGGGLEGATLRLLPNSEVIREENNGGLLSADCVLLQDGLPALEQPAFTLELTPVDGATEVPEGWVFPEFGTWALRCSASVDGEALQAEREIAVLDDAFDPRLAAVGGGLGSSLIGMNALLAADGQDDQLLVDAVASLEAAAAELDGIELATLSDVLLPVPNGYPSAAALDQAGIVANADDATLPAALADVAAALDNLAAVYAGLDANAEPTQADLDQLAAAGAELQTAVEAASALEPTAHGWLANRDTLAALIRDQVEPTMQAIDGYAIARTKAEADAVFGVAPPKPGLKPKFGLLSLTIGMFNLGYTQATLINWFYGDAIAAADKSINNLILSSLIDYFLPPNPNGPVIDILQASASIGFAVPGYDTWAYGSNFNTDPAYNMFIILGDQWQGVVDSILDLCGVSEDNTAPENYQAFQDCAQQIQDAVDNSIVYPQEVVTPGLLGENDVHLGPFPQACGGFLPVATLVIPVNLAVGRGPTWLTNCLP